MSKSLFSARYAYARVNFKNYDAGQPVEVVVGVEILSREEATPVWMFYGEIRNLLEGDVRRNVERGLCDVDIARDVEETIRINFPGRSYFVEVGRGEDDEWVQVFEPHQHNEAAS